MQHMHHVDNCDGQHMCVAQYDQGWLIIHLWVYSYKRTVAMAPLETYHDFFHTDEKWSSPVVIDCDMP